MSSSFAEPSSSTVGASAGQGGVIVYVVDDDSFMRSSLQRLFVAAGMGVETYASGQELLSGCSFANGGVLLLDVKMPGMTGLELQRAVRNRGVVLPVVFLTGSGDIAMAVEAMRDGAVDFLEKPFDNADLVERVRRASSRVAALSASLSVNYEFARRKSALTAREAEVLEKMVTGKTSKMIGRDLGASHRTIEIHRARVMEKMEVKTLADLVRMAIGADLGA